MSRILRSRNAVATTYRLGCGVSLRVPRNRVDRPVLRGDGYRATVSRREAAGELHYERLVRKSS